MTQALPIPRLAYSLSDAHKALGISKSTLLTLIREGKLPAKKLGARTLILKQVLEDFVAGLEDHKPHSGSVK